MNIRLEYQEYHYRSFIYVKELGMNKVLIINCLFVSNFYSYLDHMFFFASTSNGSVEFINCQFINNGINVPLKAVGVLIVLDSFINVEFNNCDFHAIEENTILQAYGKEGN